MNGVRRDIARLPGIRPGVLLLLGSRGIGVHRVRSLITIAVIALATTAVVASSGRTDATRRSLLARLEDPAARLVRIADRDGAAHLSAMQVELISRLGPVAWVIGLGPAGPIARNPALGDARRGNASEPVGSRLYWGDLTGGPLVRLRSGREPSAREALAGQRAADALRLKDGVGTVDDEDLGPTGVVGTVSATGPVENLSAYLLIPARGGDEPISEIIMLAATSAEVEALVNRLPNIIAAQTPVAIDRATQLLEIREALAADVGELDAAILAGSLGSSVLLVGTILYGAIEERRREFGLRRSQGATRSTIAGLVLIETTLLAIAGTALGGAIGSLAVVAGVGEFPDPLLTLAVCALVSLVAVGGAAIPAVVAAFRQPLYVLRSE